MVISAVFYNVAHKIPVIKFHEERTAQALSQREHSGMSLRHVRLGWEVYDRCFHASGDERIDVGGCIATLLGFCSILSFGLLARSDVYHDRDSCSYTDMLIGTHE
ncbi:hypothetical protein HID58_072310, partial [Brassica napus]